MLKNVKCARCVKCAKEYEAVPNLTSCSCGGILDIIYDNDYNKKKKVKIRLLTHDFIDIGVDSYDGGVEIINDIERQTEI